uniref:SUN domain-containing protein n=1 Tax=Rhabditophanes sp. KR3021 TaxID=114890 RepID=A0AC35UC05_9BILA
MSSGKECGAKVLLSNDEAEFKTAILNDKERDIYMRNPCDKADQKFVVVELCETIVPMTVELANFELFSSGPNLFKVYISERFPSADWMLVGEFEMQNNRDIQKFALKKTGVFAKYIKLELLSHWGKEHYCTLSMVRIFGVSMVDEYEAEASAISAPPPSMPSSILSNTPPILIPSQISVEQPSESTEKDVKVDDENTTQPVIVKTLVDKVVNAVGSQIEGIIRTVMSNGDLNATKIKAIPPVTLKEMCAIPKANSSYELCYFFNHVIRYAKVNDVSLKKQEQKRPMPMARNIDYLKQRDVYGRKKKAQRRLLINQRVKALKLKKEEVKTIEKKIIIQNGGDHSLPAASTNYKESVFLKLSKRLSNLELNISLSSEYLGELSKRYVQQTNDNKKMHENTIKKSEDLVKHMMLKFKKELSRDVTSLRKELIKIRNFSKHSPKSIFENALSVTEKPSTIPDECMAEPTLLIHQGNDNIWTTEQVVYVALSAQCFTIFTIFLFQYIFSRMSRSKELKNDEVEVLRKEIENIKKEIKDKNVETSSNNVDQFANKKRKKRNRKLVIHVDNEWDSALDVPSIPSETPTPSEFSLESDRLPLPSSVHDYHNKNMINNGFQIHSNKKNSKLKKMNINFIK